MSVRARQLVLGLCRFSGSGQRIAPGLHRTFRAWNFPKTHAHQGLCLHAKSSLKRDTQGWWAGSVPQHRGDAAHAAGDDRGHRRTEALSQRSQISILMSDTAQQRKFQEHHVHYP